MADRTPSPTQFVIAHYNENLDWLDEVADSCIIYTKGKDTPRFPDVTQKLQNIGREGHTYLHHITSHYDDLAPVTCFLQGRVDDHINLSTKEIYRRASLTQPGEVTTFPWRDMETFDLWDGIPWAEFPSWAKWSSMDNKEGKMTPGEYFTSLFGFPSVPDAVGFQPGALFAVHRDTIRQHPKAYYQRIFEDFFLGDMAHISPETGHYMERYWLAMWCPQEYICWNYKTDTAAEERNAAGQLARGRWWNTPRHVKLDLRTVEPSLRAQMENRRGSATPPSMAASDSDESSSNPDESIGLESEMLHRGIGMESD